MKESVSINVKTKQVVRAQGLLHENHVRMHLMIHRSRHCIKTAFDNSVFFPSAPWIPTCEARATGEGEIENAVSIWLAFTGRKTR